MGRGRPILSRLGVLTERHKLLSRVRDRAPATDVFLLRVSIPMLAEGDIAMANPSVCLSVTLAYCTETNAHIVKLFPLCGADMTSFFC